mgnify:CR=1 FL=1|tara:strand:+ start:4787 stop:6445 length:1659 start_codon:yes stop_codon:yes gene_type:complete
MLTRLLFIAYSVFANPLYVALKQQNTHQLVTLLQSRSHPHSIHYGDYLNLETINYLIQPDEQKKDLLHEWFIKNNLEVTDFGDAFKVTGTYENLYETFQFDENTATYKIPKRFSEIVEFVEGFNVNNRKNKTSPSINPQYPIHKQSVRGNGVDNRYVGKEAFYWLYNISDTLSYGGNSSIASVEYGPGNGFSVDDLQSAEELNNVSVTNIHHIINAYGGSDVESQLDMQMMAINLGSNSDIWYWNNDKWLYSLAVDMFNNNTIPDVISMSYGWSENDQCSITSCGKFTSQDYVNRVNIEYIKLGLRGVSITVSSGDAGAPGRTSEGCDPSRPLNPAFPGSSPWITSVGATFVVANNEIRNWNSSLCKEYGCIGNTIQKVTNYNEVGWTSGGGIAKLSESFTMQQQAIKEYLNSGVSLPKNVSSNGRMYPDISLIGHYCPVIDSGGLIAVDGTSCSCPLFASIITLLNEHQIKRGRPKLGYINPILYMMYYENAGCFNDIDVGNNWCTEVDCCPSNERNGSDFGFKAAKGYDPVYGLGTPNVECMRWWLDRNT